MGTNITKKLTGKVALVTGGSRGIGAPIVRRLTADGADVAFSCAASADKAKRTFWRAEPCKIMNESVKISPSRAERIGFETAAILASASPLGIIAMGAFPLSLIALGQIRRRAWSESSVEEQRPPR